jgi:ABC-type glycerol-3-phosphate transport system substrate-binding protein
MYKLFRIKFTVRIINAAAAIVAVALIFASCSPQAATEEPIFAPPRITASPVPDNHGDGVTGDAGFIETDMDLQGREIRIGTMNVGRYTFAAGNNLNTPDETLEVIKVMNKISEEYNCAVTFELISGETLHTVLEADRTAGINRFDIIELNVAETYIEKLYSAQYFITVDNPLITNIMKPNDNPWHELSNLSRFKGVRHGVHFKAFNSVDVLQSALIFNKELAAVYELGDIYSMVRAKTWTWEVFLDMCAKIIERSEGMVKPLVYGSAAMLAPSLAASNGGRFADNHDGGFTFTAHTDAAALEALGFLAELARGGFLHGGSGSALYAEYAGSVGEAVFIANNYTNLKKYYQQSVSTDFTFGLLPFPLGSGGGEGGEYEYTNVYSSESLFHISAGTDTPEEVAAILVAMANRLSVVDVIRRESENTLYDAESAEVLRILLDNIVIDYSMIISGGRTVMGRAVRNVINLQQTPQTAMNVIAPQMQAIYNM